MTKSLVPILLAALAAGCAAMGGGSGATAVAKLQPTKGNQASGQITFTQSGDTVRVSGTLEGLKPDGEHAFHVHEKGDCSSGDGMSTGGHFNPLAKPHGAHGGSEHHAGDLPSVKADAYGRATISFTSKTISVGAGPTDVIGRGLIVHRDPDDFKTQPTGNAGPRIACAVIQKS